MTPFSLNFHGRLVSYERPVLMTIINLTPDSFYKNSRNTTLVELAKTVENALVEGADILDVGAYSSRPGAEDVPLQEELSRLEKGMRLIREIAPDIPISVDTFRAEVARRSVNDFGADMVNDISGGNLDTEMFTTVASLKVPYVLMHMRGNPSTMQSLAHYPDGVVKEVMVELAEKLNELSLLGVNDVIVDPGFGFAKDLRQNYELLSDLQVFGKLGKPLLVGVSRKSMVTRLLGVSAEEALNGTTVLNTIALANGASMLRVHDTRAAKEAIEIYQFMNHDK